MPTIHIRTSGEEGVSLLRQLLAGALLASESAGRALDLQLQGRLDEAEAEYEESLAVNPQNVYALNNLGHLYLTRQQFGAALPLLLKAVEIEPGYASAHNNLGNVHLNLGQVGEAVARYRDAARANENYAMPHRNLGLALHLLGQSEEAADEYRTYFSLAPEGT